MSDGQMMGGDGSNADSSPKKRRLPLRLNRGNGPNPGPGSRKVILVLTVLVFVLILIVAVIVFFQRNGLDGGDTEGPALVEQRELELTDAQSTFAELGPWAESVIVDGVEQPRSADTIVWLGEDGSIQESNLSVPPSVVDWRASRPPFITNLGTGDKLMVLTIAQRFDYTIHKGQPFMYEAQPDTVYRLDPATGDVLAVSTTTIQQALAAGN